ncbi:putative membrane protein [Vibrio harveyi]|nr:putative membrane protein [Vibrio harveyi]
MFGAIVVVVLFHLFGSLFGPLYQSEDESARNFVIFLACLFLGIVSGALFAYKYTVK